MIYAKILIQIVVVVVLIFFVSGRLMGSQINFMKRIMSVAISVAITSLVFWYSYLRRTDYLVGRLCIHGYQHDYLDWKYVTHNDASVSFF